MVRAFAGDSTITNCLPVVFGFSKERVLLFKVLFSAISINLQKFKVMGPLMNPTSELRGKASRKTLITERTFFRGAA